MDFWESRIKRGKSALVLSNRPRLPTHLQLVLDAFLQLSPGRSWVGSMVVVPGGLSFEAIDRWASRRALDQHFVDFYQKRAAKKPPPSKTPTPTSRPSRTRLQG